ncbi:MAG: amidohydrolase, partial [Candidatus Dormibacteraeota bacterium]|nr:amidohydrolase [Candidatus Dormibacteraeota bacterium]
HSWHSQVEVTDRMPEGWREQIGRPGTLPGGAGAMPLLPSLPWHHPNGDHLSTGAGGGSPPPGSSPELVAAELLGSGAVRRAVLSPDRGMFVPAVPNTYRAAAVVRAINDWTIERWLGTDERFCGLVLVPNQTPSEGAEEVRRAGAHERMVGVLMAANGLGRPFGHPAYHPIYEAAAEMNLPVVLHVGGDALADTLTHPTAGGLPSTFGEVSALAYSPMMTHVQSFIVQGLFEKYPDLRLLVLGAGVAWIPGLFFRLDVNWRGLRREVPWVRRPPSEYFREHVRVSTWPLERPAGPEGAGRLVRLLEAFGGAEELLCFASGHPHWNTDSVADVAARLPAAWHARVFHDNAAEWFRWSRAARPPRRPAVEVGAMPASGQGDVPPAERTYEPEDGHEVEWTPAAD